MDLAADFEIVADRSVDQGIERFINLWCKWEGFHDHAHWPPSAHVFNVGREALMGAQQVALPPI